MAMARARRHDAPAQRARLPLAGRAAGGVADPIHRAVHLIGIGRIAASSPVLVAAAVNRVREHVRRPILREAPLASPHGVPAG
jgi:hypothetical protein